MEDFDTEKGTLGDKMCNKAMAQGEPESSEHTYTCIYLKIYIPPGYISLFFFLFPWQLFYKPQPRCRQHFLGFPQHLTYLLHGSESDAWSIL